MGVLFCSVRALDEFDDESLASVCALAVDKLVEH